VRNGSAGGGLSTSRRCNDQLTPRRKELVILTVARSQRTLVGPARGHRTGNGRRGRGDPGHRRPRLLRVRRRGVRPLPVRRGRRHGGDRPDPRGAGQRVPRRSSRSGCSSTSTSASATTWRRSTSPSRAASSSGGRQRTTVSPTCSRNDAAARRRAGGGSRRSARPRRPASGRCSDGREYTHRTRGATIGQFGGIPWPGAPFTDQFYAHWWIFPASILFSAVALASGVSGALFFSPFFMLVVGLSPSLRPSVPAC